MPQSDDQPRHGKPTGIADRVAPRPRGKRKQRRAGRKGSGGRLPTGKQEKTQRRIA